MSMQSHLSELVKRHETLEKEIETAQIHPATSDLKLKELKLKKLQIKEEIEKIKSKITAPALH